MEKDQNIEEKQLSMHKHIVHDTSHVLDSTINSATLPSLDEEYKQQPPREQTGGEKLFDRAVYTGIGFGVNEASSLIVADQFEHGVGKNLYKKTADWMVKNLKFATKTNKNGTHISAHQNASNALLTFTLLFSGTLLVAPMKWLEDHKEHFVRKTNHWLDGFRKEKLTDEQVATRDKEVEGAIACQPKQSWSSLLVGRTIAYFAVMTNSMYLMGPERMKQSGNFSENLLVHRKFSTKETLPVGRERNMAERLANLTGIETICCAISSVVLETSSKIFSGFKKDNIVVHNPEVCAAKVDGEAGNAGTEDANKDEKTQNTAAKPTIAFADAALAQKSNPRAIIDAKAKDESFAARALASQSNDTMQIGT